MHIASVVKQSGFTLTEMLISFTVLSVGLLGLAGLQITSIKHNEKTFNRFQASNLAYSISESIKANPYGSYQHTYNSPETPLSSINNCSHIKSNCNLNEMAQYDTHHWLNEVSLALPKGEGQIKNTNNDVYRIQIRWDSNHDSIANEKYTTIVRIN